MTRESNFKRKQGLLLTILSILSVVAAITGIIIVSGSLLSSCLQHKRLSTACRIECHPFMYLNCAETDNWLVCVCASDVRDNHGISTRVIVKP